MLRRTILLVLWLLPACSSSTTAPLPAQGAACPAGGCAAGLTCLSYYGIAGPAGPLFRTCEIPCPTGAAACPAPQVCITIVDGPGTVCRPR